MSASQKHTLEKLYKCIGDINTNTIQIFDWHKHNYNNWQRPKVKLQFMSMNMTLLSILNNLISKS